MEIIEVSADKFGQVFSVPYHIYASAPFNELNRNKCEAVFYLIFKDTKYRLGIIGGVMQNSFQSPFSAPFGGFVTASDDIRLPYVDTAIEMLESWAKQKGYESISITLPPSIYNETFIAKQSNSLYRKGFLISKLDLNYSFSLNNFNPDYENLLWYNARKNLHIAFKKNLVFSICSTFEENRLAYEVILKNREYRGFLLPMTWKQVEDTALLVPIDFFLVRDAENRVVASALVIHVNKNVVQVIYWGDLPGHSENKPMNFLSYKVLEYYKLSGKSITDIGPSTKNSIPLYGLCEFKESIGCDISTKFTLTKQINHNGT